MAELRDYLEDMSPDEVLRLSIKWQSIRTDVRFKGDLLGELAVGLFVGETPLFAAPIYRSRFQRNDPPMMPGYFYANDEDMELVRMFERALKVGAHEHFETSPDPYLTIAIAPNLADPEPARPHAEYFDILIIIQWGGPWHRQIWAESGPGARLSVTRDQLKKFVVDLRSEADQIALARTTKITP